MCSALYEAFCTTYFLIHKMLQRVVLFSLFPATFYEQMRKLRYGGIKRELVNGDVWSKARMYDFQILLLPLNVMAKSIWKTPDQLLFDPTWNIENY